MASEAFLRPAGENRYEIVDFDTGEVIALAVGTPEHPGWQMAARFMQHQLLKWRVPAGEEMNGWIEKEVGK
jgi:hypothetical protein